MCCSPHLVCVCRVTWVHSAALPWTMPVVRPRQSRSPRRSHRHPSRKLPPRRRRNPPKRALRPPRPLPNAHLLVRVPPFTLITHWLQSSRHWDDAVVDTACNSLRKCIAASSLGFVAQAQGMLLGASADCEPTPQRSCSEFPLNIFPAFFCKPLRASAQYCSMMVTRSNTQLHAKTTARQVSKFAAPSCLTSALALAFCPTGGRVAASPYARKLAKEAGVNISQAQATGPEGRIVAADVQKLISSGGGKPSEAGADAGAPAPAAAAADSAVSVVAAWAMHRA